MESSSLPPQQALLETPPSEAEIEMQRQQQQLLQLQVHAREVVVVAGGTGLLGAAIVKALLFCNALVVVPSRHEEQLNELIKEIAATCAFGFPRTPMTERSSAPVLRGCLPTDEAEHRLHEIEQIQSDTSTSPQELHLLHLPHTPPSTTTTTPTTPTTPFTTTPATTTPTTTTTTTPTTTTTTTFSLDNPADTTHKRQIGRLFTIVADIGEPSGAAFIREKVLQRFGRIDRVIDALSRFWGKGLTTQQPYEEWEKALHDMVGVHFVCVKEFLPILRDNKRGSYTFVTARPGEACIQAETGLMTVGTAALFGLVDAIKAEAKSYKGVTINEVRLGLRVISEEDKERDHLMYGEHTSVDPTLIGKVIAGISLSSTTHTENPPYYLYSMQEVDEVLKNIWNVAKEGACKPGQLSSSSMEVQIQHT